MSTLMRDDRTQYKRCEKKLQWRREQQRKKNGNISRKSPLRKTRNPNIEI